MRIIDADILSYALVENHIATPYARPIVERGLRGELEIYVTATTLLEAYNTLLWHYRVRPKTLVAEKILIISEGLKPISTSMRGFEMAVREDVPLGDALLIGTALENRIPIVVSNDRHIRRLCDRYGLIYENPIPEDIRERMAQ